jgi:hypothetical protein
MVWVIFTNQHFVFFISISGPFALVCVGGRSSRLLHPIQKDSFLPRPSEWEKTVRAARAAVPRSSLRLPLEESWSSLPVLFKRNFPFSKSR